MGAGARVIVMSHLGRPKEGEFSAEDSLAPVAARLGELLAAIAEGQYCGSVTDEQSAVELARTLLASGD